MNRFTIILLLSLSVFLSGCATPTPDIKYSDLGPATTATVFRNTVTLHLGSNRLASAAWTIPKTKISGQTIYVVGYRTLLEQNQEFKVRLPKSVNPYLVSVIWIDPDGSQIMVPITKYTP